MNWIENKRLVVFLSIACLFACAFATFSFIRMLSFTGTIFSPSSPSSEVAKYEITIIDDHKCVPQPNSFLIEIENKGHAPIKSYILGPMIVLLEKRPAITPRMNSQSFGTGHRSVCPPDSKDIEPGEKGYISVGFSHIVPGDVPTEFTLKLCLEEPYESCQAERISYTTKTPVQDTQAMSDMELSLDGVTTHPCFSNYLTTVFTIKNSGQTILFNPSHETKDHNDGQDVHFILKDNWENCEAYRQTPTWFLEPNEESTLLLSWKGSPPDIGTLVETTITMCPPTNRYVDNTVPCTSQKYEFYIPEY